MLTLWQTSMLRGTKLKVVDEVANGLSYYDYTFLRELPRFYAALEDQLASTDPAWDGFELPSFLRVGSWIGGDRDGNPFVTAEVLRQALGMQSERALKFYLDEVHLLGGELSLDARLVTVSDQLKDLAERSPDRSPHRRNEPYRQAISGIYARLAATARAFEQAEASRHAVGEAPPYAEAAEFVADLGILYHSLTANGSATLARSRLRSLRRAANTFGFYLAGIDLRQNSAVHERTVGELFEMTCADIELCRPPRSCPHLPPARGAQDRATAFFAFPTLFRGDGLGADNPSRSSRGTPALWQGRGAQLRDLEDERGLGPSRGRAAAQGGRTVAAA